VNNKLYFYDKPYLYQFEDDSPVACPRNGSSRDGKQAVTDVREAVIFNPSVMQRLELRTILILVWLLGTYIESSLSAESELCTSEQINLKVNLTACKYGLRY